MNPYSITDHLPLVVVIPLLLVLVAAPCALGYLAGRRAVLAGAKPEQSIGTIVGATLALLTFMLAFAFNAAYARYDTRRQLTLTEAAAIELTYRNAQMLPGDHGREMHRLLSEYLDIRIRAATEPLTLLEGIARTNELIDEMWDHAHAAAAQDSSSQIVRLFVDSLSETTKVNTLRITAALRSRTPPTIWFALSVIVILAISGIGYQTALASNWRTLPLLLAITAFTTVMALIADLDRPQEGLVRVSQGALEDVRSRLFRETP